MRTYSQSDPAQRFWAKVRKDEGCWVWVGGTNGIGYGQFSVRVAPNRWKRMLAHRFAWEMHVGPIPVTWRNDSNGYYAGWVEMTMEEKAP